MTFLDKIKQTIAEHKAASAKMIADIKMAETKDEAAAPVAPEAEKKKEEVKAASPEERITALEAVVAELKASIEELAKASGPDEATEQMMSELKKENKNLSKKVKEMSDAPAAPALQFSKIEASDASNDFKADDVIPGESIKATVRRLSALRDLKK